MANTVFYSWQSDCPNSTNRTFIEEALKKAIKEISTGIEVLKAVREDLLEFDKDTQGVPGTPPITAVIFQKISKATVFVPDLTLVGKTENERLMPNPNVLIEYGWALCALGHSRMVPVMNTAFGEATRENLPFNMRHLRNPITYKLPENAAQEEKSIVKTELVRQIVQAIRLILKNLPPEAELSSSGHIETPSTEDPSTFLKKDEFLGVIGGGHREELQLVVPDNEHLFLRVIPQKPTQKINSSQKVLALLEKKQIMPCTSSACGFSRGRNQYGAFTVAHDKEKVLSVTQVFCNREIWGIDADSIDKKGIMDWMKVDFGYFPCSGIEDWFIQTLSAYLPFCRDTLELPLPLTFIAGATRVKGYKMIAPNGMHFNGIEKFAGRVVDDHILYEGEIADFDSDPKVLLRPFFEKIWEECDLQRPDREKL